MEDSFLDIATNLSISTMNVETIFDRFNQVNVLIVGDVMIDRYLNGKIERISPEAPVPVVNLQASENRLGGAANVALNVKALGATPYLCSVVGDDKYGQLFQEILTEASISTKYISVSSQRRTTVKTRIIASNQHVLRVDEEDTKNLSEDEQEDYLSIIKELLDQKEIQVILFQDYNKGVLNTRTIREIILEGIKRDIPTVVDPKFKNFWEYKRVNLFKPNLREIAAKVPFEVKADLESLKKATQYIKQQIGNHHTMITLSSQGIFVDEKGGKISPTKQRAIADVCGAGDAVISAAALGLACGMELSKIVQLANLAGGQVCERVGVSPVDLKQLKKEYKVLISGV
ncbi:MAG: bifunctional ADP-heptose synthase [Bacteroidota bacterium]